jgi:hypothetical protein
MANAWPIHAGGVCDCFCSLFSSFHYKRFVHPFLKEKEIIYLKFFINFKLKKERVIQRENKIKERVVRGKGKSIVGHNNKPDSY